MAMNSGGRMTLGGITPDAWSPVVKAEHWTFVQLANCTIVQDED